MRIYLIGSFYTLLNSCNLEMTFHDGDTKSALIVFGDVKELVEKKSKEIKDIFNSIFFYPHPKNLSFRDIAEFMVIKHKNEELISGKDYLVITQNFSFTFMLPRSIRKAARYWFIEDGLSTYTDYNNSTDHRNSILQILNAYFYKGKLFPKIDSVLVYDKRLYLGNHDIRELPNIDNYKMNKIFGKNRRKLPNNIFLGTPISSLKSVLNTDLSKSESDDFERLTLMIRNRVLASVNNRDWYYKKHPSEREVLPNDLTLGNLESETPWEIDISSLTSDSTLISYFSTAMITPKLLFNLEPRIIFLFKLFRGFDFYRADDIVDKVTGLYGNSSKVCLPESWMELEELLRR